MQNFIPEEVMIEADAALEAEFADFPRGLGFCHMAWAWKKNWLAWRGYDWTTPQELEPYVLFD